MFKDIFFKISPVSDSIMYPANIDNTNPTNMLIINSINWSINSLDKPKYPPTKETITTAMINKCVFCSNSSPGFFFDILSSTHKPQHIVLYKHLNTLYCI